MTERQELLDATDETIEDAVRFADPMVLRGLLYQLTGDDSVAATEVHGRVLGLVEAMVLANPSDAELLQSKAAEFLKSYRDSGADDIPIGPADRLPTSLEPGLRRGDRRGRAGDVAGAARPRPVGARTRLARRAAAGPAAGVLRGRDRRRRRRPGRGRPPQAGRRALRRDREELRGRRNVVREPLPGRTCRHPESHLHAHLRRRLRVPEPVLRAEREREVLQLDRRRVRGARTTSSSTPR